MDIKEITPHYTISVNEVRAMILSESLDPFCDALKIEDEHHSKAVDLRGDSNFLHYYFVFSPEIASKADFIISEVENLIPGISSVFAHELPAEIFMAWGLSLTESHKIVAAGCFLGIWEQVTSNKQMPTLKWEYKEYMDLYMCNFARVGYIENADKELALENSSDYKKRIALIMNRSEKVAVSILEDLSVDGFHSITRSVRAIGLKDTKGVYNEFFDEGALKTPETIH